MENCIDHCNDDPRSMGMMVDDPNYCKKICSKPRGGGK